MWTTIQIEALRLAEIAYVCRLTGARAAPLNAPSEWIGWQIITPDGERRRYLKRRVEGVCTRCGGSPLASRTLCERCRERQRAASATHRERRGARPRGYHRRGDAAAQFGLCSRCGRRPPAAGRRTCETCSAAQRARLAVFRARRG